MGLSVAFDRFSQFDVFIHLDPFNIKLRKQVFNEKKTLKRINKGYVLYISFMDKCLGFYKKRAEKILESE